MNGVADYTGCLVVVLNTVSWLVETVEATKSRWKVFPHRLLLRADIHRLFDQGYVTCHDRYGAINE